jgi:hypothetical protein
MGRKIQIDKQVRNCRSATTEGSTCGKEKREREAMVEARANQATTPSQQRLNWRPLEPFKSVLPEIMKILQMMQLIRRSAKIKHRRRRQAWIVE